MLQLVIHKNTLFYRNSSVVYFDFKNFLKSNKWYSFAYSNIRILRVQYLITNYIAPDFGRLDATFDSIGDLAASPIIENPISSFHNLTFICHIRWAPLCWQTRRLFSWQFGAAPDSVAYGTSSPHGYTLLCAPFEKLPHFHTKAPWNQVRVNRLQKDI